MKILLINYSLLDLYPGKTIVTNLGGIALNRFMRLFGICVLFLSGVLAIVDWLTKLDLLLYWGTGVLIHQFTMGYSLYFEEDRKILGLIIMGSLFGVFALALYVKFT